MKCPNCGEENPDEMKFCVNCGTKLPEKKNFCPNCNKEWPLTMKFCGECGFKFGTEGAGNTGGGTAGAQGGISMGDKNVIAGDVIGKKDETNITGNATIIKNEDETKKTAKCHVCGRIVIRIEGYDCPVCGQFTCKDCYAPEAGKCISCRDNAGNQKEDVYKQAVKRVLEDGKIDMEERNELRSLQQQLGISQSRALELENIVKSQMNSKTTNQLGNFDRISFEKARTELYDELKYQEAITLLEPLCMKYSNNEEILADYLYALSKVDAQKARNVINTIHADVLCSYLTMIDIAAQEGDYSLVEEYITKAEKLWSEEILLKCRKADFNLKLAELSGDDSYLSIAKEIVDRCTEPKNKLERTWVLKIQKDVLRNDSSLMTEEELASKDVYKGFFDSYIIKNTQIEYKVTICDNPCHENDFTVGISSKTGVLERQQYKDEHPEFNISRFVTYAGAIALSRYKQYSDKKERKVFVAAIVNGRLDFYLFDFDECVYEVIFQESQKIQSSNIIETIEQYIKNGEYKWVDNQNVIHSKDFKDITDILLCTDLNINMNGIDLDGRYIKCTKLSTQAITDGLRVQGGILCKNLNEDILLLDVTTSSIGIRSHDGTFTRLLPSNTTIPSKKSQIFTVKELKEKYLPLEVVECIGDTYKDNQPESSFNTLLSLDNYLFDQDDNAEIELTIDVDPNYKTSFFINYGDSIPSAQYILPSKDNRPISDSPFDYFIRATQNDEPYAQNQLGNCYYNGQGVKQDYSKAVEWYTKAAEWDANAQINLGTCYYNGQGVKQDYSKAVEWYTKAAEWNANAQIDLGNCYYNGLGVKQDYSKAVEWYTKAAERGNASAQNMLGICYYNGKGVKQDYSKAVEWFTKAAEWDASAQSNLGSCYYNGLGVKKDDEKAKEWYKKAAANGNQTAKESLKNLGWE